MKSFTSINIINWMARIIGIVMVALTLFIGISEIFEAQNKPSTGLDTYTIITFIIWGIGLAGLLFANWKPGTGGSISLISFIIFNILVAVNPNPDYTYSTVLLLFLLPSILFIIVWKLKRAK